MRWLNSLPISTRIVGGSLLSLMLFAVFTLSLMRMTTEEVLREEARTQNLPRLVDGVQAEIRRQLAGPIHAALALAANPVLLDWETAGLPDEGVALWKRYVTAVQRDYHADKVSWVSERTQKIMNNSGFYRKLQPKDTWFEPFIRGNRPYQLSLYTPEKGASSLFINARARTADGLNAAVGVGLPIEPLMNWISGTAQGADGLTVVASSQGEILMHPDKDWVLKRRTLAELPGLNAEVAKTLTLPPAVQSTQADRSVSQARVESISLDGAPHWVAASYLPELDAWVVTRVSERELLEDVTSAIRHTSWVAGGASAVLCVVLVLVLTRTVVSPIARAAGLLDEIAAGGGDLTRRMEVEAKDELGRLADAFNRFSTSLAAIVRQVRSGNARILEATESLVAGNGTLAGRTASAAQSIDSTTRSLAELSDAVQNNSRAAQSASTLVHQVHAVTGQSAAAVEQVVSKMSQINASSQKIGDIIGVIDGIAFQTNILALNAAVEAARAGEQGRGFAVVATEVRALATRSADSAKQIRSLINDSVQQVEDGAGLIAAAGRTMGELSGSVTRMTTLIDEISQESRGQSERISHLHGGMRDLEAIARDNGSLVEDSTETSARLREQVREMEDAVGAFKV